MRAPGVFFRRESTIQPIVEIAADTGIVSGVSIMDDVMDNADIRKAHCSEFHTVWDSPPDFLATSSDVKRYFSV